MFSLEPRALQYAWTWFLFALAAVVVYLIRDTLVTFALAVFLALVLSPVVALVERFTPVRFPRAAALAVVYVLLLAGLAAIFAGVISTITSEARLLAQKLPEAIGRNPLDQIPLPPWLEPLRVRAAAAMEERLREVSRDALPLVARAMQQVVSGAGALLSGILIPILAFFFLKDGKAIRKALIRVLDEPRRPLAAAILSDLRTVLSEYVRALVILAAVTFVCYFAFLALTGAPYSALLSGAAALLEFIPGVGPFLAAVAIVAVTVFSGYVHWIWLLAFLGAYRLAQDYVLQPALMSSGVQLHPLMVIFGALAGGEIAGVTGVFFSIPILAASRVLLKRLRPPSAAAPRHR